MRPKTQFGQMASAYQTFGQATIEPTDHSAKRPFGQSHTPIGKFGEVWLSAEWPLDEGLSVDWAYNNKIYKTELLASEFRFKKQVFITISIISVDAQRMFRHVTVATLNFIIDYPFKGIPKLKKNTSPYKKKTVYDNNTKRTRLQARI